jgi:predicted transposase YdaD
MKRRVARVRNRGRLGRWWTAVYVLMGMRYEQTLVTQLLQGVLDMEESVTYQAIIRKGVDKGRVEGALQEARKMLLRLGETHFRAPPSDVIQNRVEKIEDLDQLERLILSLEPLRSWDELLAALPKTKRRSASQR